MSAQQSAEFLASSRIGRKGEFRHHWQDVANVQRDVFLSAGIRHFPSVFQANGNRLFHKDWFPGCNGCQYDFSVHVRRDTDIHQIHIRVVDQIVVVGIPLEVRHVHLTARRAKVALDAGPVPTELLFASCRDGRDLATLNRTSSLKVGKPHESDSDDSDTHHDDSAF